MFVYLDKQDINRILELQEIVYSSLSDEEKAYLLPKSREKMEAHFAQGNFVEGYVMDNKLVAQAFIKNPSNAYPDTGMVDMKSAGDVTDGISVLQGVVVHPDYQGHGLGSKLVRSWVHACAAMHKNIMLGEVAVGNYKSFGAFIHAGLEIDSMGIDPEDGTEVFNIKGNPAKAMLKKSFNCCTCKQDNSCLSFSYYDIDSIRDAFNDNYVGTHWNKKDKVLTLHKRNCAF